MEKVTFLPPKFLKESSSESEIDDDNEEEEVQEKNEGVSERVSRKIQEFKEQTSLVNENINPYDVKQLLLQESEFYKKIMMSKAIDEIKSDYQKQLIANTLLDEESTSQGSELRQKWIINTISKKKEEEPSNNHFKLILKEYKFDQRDIILQGKLEKYVTGVIGKWKEVQCILLKDRLNIYKEKKQFNKLKNSVLFSYFTTTCELIEKQTVLIIKVDQADLYLKLRLSKIRNENSSCNSLQEWGSTLSAIILMTSALPKYHMQQKITQSLCKIGGILEKEFLNNVQSGDILLFQTKTLVAQLQRATTSSQYDHVALLVKLKDGVVRVFEAVEDGVSITQWDQFVHENGQFASIVYRPLVYAKRQSVLPELYQFISKTIGSKYKLSFSKLTKNNSLEKNEGSKPREYFCSELTAKAFKEMGIITQITASSKYWPRSFSSDYDYLELKLYDKAYLLPERMILLDVEILNKK